ncbi:MAG: LPS assembly protein LptD [Rickettsiales bacterium]|jgi:LPS-assembly protein|nr:LPS assembly protein LptD [Rickettsiales bacterium]
MRKILIFLAAASMPAFAAPLDYKDIRSDKIVYGAKSGDMRASGKTEIILTGGQKMTLQNAHAAKGSMELKDMRMEWSEHVFLTARSLDKDGDITLGAGVSYTACHGCDDYDAWTMHARRMRHDASEKNFYFYDFWMDIFGLPVLWLPVFSQPDPTVKHRSGFLMPEFGSTTNMGTKIGIPFYLSFSEHHDATLTAAVLTEENPMLEVEHRLRLDHASFDSAVSHTRNRAGLSRWHFLSRDSIDLGESMRLRLNLQRASDTTYLQQYGFYSAQPFLESSSRLEAFAERGYATAEANIFQELRKELTTDRMSLPAGNILPRLHGAYMAPLGGGLYSELGADVLRISSGPASINRAIGEARLIFPMEIAWQKITLSAAARGDLYQYNEISGADGRHDRLLPSAYADWEMPFVRRSDSAVHIIKPKIRMTIAGKSGGDGFLNLDSTGSLLSDVSLFSSSRYAGYDLWANGAYADYGVSWTWADADGRSAGAFIGQTYDMGADSEPDVNSGYRNGASDYVGRLSADPYGWLSVLGRFRLSRDDLDVRHVETDVRVGGRNYVSAGYIWTVQFEAADDAFLEAGKVSELTAGGGAHFTDRLSLRGSGNYNMEAGLFQKYNAGVYYEHPCWELALLYNVDNSVKIAGGSNPDMDFRGVSSWKLNFKIKMGR